jgi:hypothetical protein
MEILAASQKEKEVDHNYDNDKNEKQFDEHHALGELDETSKETTLAPTAEAVVPHEEAKDDDDDGHEDQSSNRMPQEDDDRDHDSAPQDEEIEEGKMINEQKQEEQTGTPPESQSSVLKDEKDSMREKQGQDKAPPASKSKAQEQLQLEKQRVDDDDMTNETNHLSQRKNDENKNKSTNERRDHEIVQTSRRGQKILSASAIHGRRTTR